jgi:hypothetical protein
MNDPRPRNGQGQFAPQEAGGIDPNTTATAYNPQIIEQRRASLLEKIRRMRGVRNGVEESVPPREQALCAKLRLCELAAIGTPEEFLQKGSAARTRRPKNEDPGSDRMKSLLIAGGAGVGLNLAAGFGAMGLISKDGSPSRRSEVIDRFARSKGYKVITPEEYGTSSKVMPAAVVPKVSSSIASSAESAGRFIRGEKAQDYVRAHEAGHVAQDLGKSRGRLIRTSVGRLAIQLAPLGAASALVNKDSANDGLAAGVAAAGTLAAAPVVANEINASVRGYKIMRRLGSSRLRATGAFLGLPTYATIAAMPALGWMARKHRQKKDEKMKQQKKLSAKLRLRELATRQLQPIEEEQKSGLGKLAAVGLGLGLGVGGGVAGVRYLRPIVSKAVGRVSGSVTQGVDDVSGAAAAAIPKMAKDTEKTAQTLQKAVKQTAANIDDATTIPRTAGKTYKWVESKVAPAVWEIRNPGKRAKEIWGNLKAGRAESDLRAKYIRRVARRANERGALGRIKQSGASKFWVDKVAQAAKENTGSVPNASTVWRPEWARRPVARPKLAGPKPGAKLYSAKLRLRELTSFSGRVIEFSEEKKKLTTGQKIGVAAGLGTAAVGAAFLPAAMKMGAIVGRRSLYDAKAKASASRILGRVVKTPNVDPNAGGRMVADYIDASQTALNKGLHGKVAGAVLRHASKNPDGLVAKGLGGGYKVSHYAGFRGGHKRALGHWDWEVDLARETQLGKDSPALNAWRKRADRQRKAVEKEINDEMYHRGRNEGEALRHVASSSQNKDVQNYFRRLAASKADAADGYAKMSLVSPGLIAAGGGTTALSLRKKKEEK